MRNICPRIRSPSETCERCGITYEAHFDHPQRCPAWMTDEVDRQAAQEPALIGWMEGFSCISPLTFGPTRVGMGF
jgi:hypothetical protein